MFMCSDLGLLVGFSVLWVWDTNYLSALVIKSNMRNALWF